MQDSKDEYPTTLPGYPPEYFKDLVPPARVDATTFQPLEPPMYNYKDLSPLAFEKTQKGNRFSPIDPASMYVSCHSWVSYPYGIPDPDQPCPYCVEPVEEEYQSQSSNTVTSVTTESDVPLAPTSPTPRQEKRVYSPTMEIPEQSEQPMPVHITETLMWTG